jgi:hypothetical protein
VNIIYTFRKIVFPSFSELSIFLGLPDHGATSLRNVSNYLPVAMAPYYRRLEFSATEVSRTPKYGAVGRRVTII